MHEYIMKLEEILKDFKNQPQQMSSIKNTPSISNQGSPAVALSRQKRLILKKWYILIEFRNFCFLLDVSILKVPLDGDLLIGYASLRDECIYGRGSNSVDALMLL